MSDLAPPAAELLHRKLVLQFQESRRTFAGYRDTFTFLLGFAGRRTGRRPTRLSISDLDAPTIGAFFQHLETVRGDPPHPSRRDAIVPALRGLRAPGHAA
ncbi:hypothetical protein [Streptomyces rishiriensis]|uniref:hypothetical protein n=1 Tax=Streptomyces rishiriensis TaxID=68264 RepID=UPI00131F3FB4|nr:hypothetical protein [Streptomyces rishiriensis]